MELTLETIRAAHARIAPYIVQTPLLCLPALDDAIGCEVYAKAECMQRTGAFKLRGAMNKILALTEDERARLCRGLVRKPRPRGGLRRAVLRHARLHRHAGDRARRQAGGHPCTGRGARALRRCRAL